MTAPAASYPNTTNPEQKEPAMTAVAIAKTHIDRMQKTIAVRAGRGLTLEQKAVDAFLLIGNHPGEVTDMVQVDAERLWWLIFGSDALDTYRLDEAADATYEHPAVVAEQAAHTALMEQAPDVLDRLDAELHRLATELAAGTQSAGPATECLPGTQPGGATEVSTRPQSAARR